ncbi:Long-chain-fatty-acid--CoA ligase [Roseimaritima multifibrata]|uniref:Long-chain-fatty-acid--CoA ligase n=1 Tax=Roseimaritima multifibrata TaxID=1930274 RepID=A0A517ME64_9BACT|nr:Long-chain-fatty-acid--CoA ligase [Roseimaritima multifibrata]
MRLIQHLHSHAQQRPNAAALWLGDQWINWSELRSLTNEITNRLLDLSPHGRVVTQFDNHFLAVIGTLAIQNAGLCEVPLGPGKPPKPLPTILAQTGATLHLTTVDMQRFFERARNGSAKPNRCFNEPSPASESLILWTSGTSASPRAVVLSWQALAANAAGKLSAAPQSESDCRLTILPLWHAYARTCELGTWLISGGQLAVSLGWEGLRSEALKIRPTLLNVVPSIASRILEKASENDLPTSIQQLGLERLRMLGCGGAPLSRQDYSALQEAGITVIHGYGLTEAGPVVCSGTPSKGRPGTVGGPIPFTQIRLDPEGRLEVRGPGLMTGYLDDPASTKACMQQDWLQTGDLASIADDGIVTILGRADDTIVLANGKKIQPTEIESLVCQLADVRHAVLWHDRKGDLVGIVECQRSTRSPETLQRTLDASVALLEKWKRPRRWVIRYGPFETDEVTTKGTPRRQIVGPRYGE